MPQDGPGSVKAELTAYLGGCCVSQLMGVPTLHTADHGRFPGSLGEIKDVKISDDLITGKPFIYSSTGSEALLQGPAPKGGKPKEAIDYKLVLKK